MNAAPEGECTCTATEQCAYCDEMQLWAHEELYGHEERTCACGRPVSRDGCCSRCLDDWEDEDDE